MPKAPVKMRKRSEGKILALFRKSEVQDRLETVKISHGFGANENKKHNQSQGLLEQTS